MAYIEEEVLAKVGPELFKELLRLYPVAEIDDYFKVGQWKNDQMKVDLQLIHTHRREAGAPDPIPLDEVKMPELPQQLPGMAVGMQGMQAPAAVRPAGVAAAPVRPVVPKAGAGVVPAAAAPGAAAGGAVTELRLIALFIAKWKLDPTKVKMIFAKLLPARRRHVIQQFKGPGSGDVAMQALQQFILKCEQTNSWGAAGAAVAPAAMTGIKRPLAPMMAAAGGPAKQPRLVAAIAQRPGMPVLRPVAGVRPAGVRPAGVRPAGVRPATVPALRPMMR